MLIVDIGLLCWDCVVALRGRSWSWMHIVNSELDIDIYVVPQNCNIALEKTAVLMLYVKIVILPWKYRDIVHNITLRGRGWSWLPPSACRQWRPCYQLARCKINKFCLLFKSMHTKLICWQIKLNFRKNLRFFIFLRLKCIWSTAIDGHGVN